MGSIPEYHEHVCMISFRNALPSAKSDTRHANRKGEMSWSVLALLFPNQAPGLNTLYYVYRRAVRQF